MIQKPKCVTTVIGPLPPPLGGIAVYLDRLRKLHPEYEFINEQCLSRFAWLVMLSKKKRHFIYHSSRVNWIILFYFLSLFTGNRYSIFSHGASLMDSYHSANRIKKYLIRLAVRSSAEVYVVNTNIGNFAAAVLGVAGNKIKVKNPFLLPDLEEEAGIMKTYSPETIAFVKQKRPLIIANASGFTFYRGRDLYGFDLCIDLMTQLIRSYPTAGLLFAVAKVDNREYYKRLQAKIAGRRLDKHFHFMIGGKEVWPLFRQADLMVRPTVTDGCSISVYEALSFGCPVLASNVCQRPPETVIFTVGDGNDFLDKTLTVLNRKIVNRGSEITGVKKMSLLQ